MSPHPSAAEVPTGPRSVRHLAKHLFFWLIVRPIVLLALGLNVRDRERLPRSGPAILAANHNSHLDTLVLMILLRPGLLPSIRPVAAADYFLTNRLVAWFSLKVIGILPVERGSGRSGRDPLAGASAALARGEIVILFPEGSRGEPERMAKLKAGIGHLAMRHPDVPVVGRARSGECRTSLCLWLTRQPRKERSGRPRSSQISWLCTCRTGRVNGQAEDEESSLVERLVRSFDRCASGSRRIA